MDETRERVAAWWREKYGDEIDCDELQVASRAAVEVGRMVLADAQSLEAFAELLDQLHQQVLVHLDEPIRGSEQSIADLWRTAADARDGRPAMPDLTGHDAPLLLFVRRVLTTLSVTAEQSRQAARDAAPWSTPAASRLGDPALDRACYLVSEWVRRRHRSTDDRLDGQVEWDDVLRCFEWHGHDFSHIAADRRGALRQRASRWANRLR